MEHSVNIKINKNDLFDYMLYHTYSGLSGILGTFVGIFLVIAYFRTDAFIYLIAGCVVIFYLPVALYLRSSRQYLNNPSFREPISYTMNSDGITVSQSEDTVTIAWSDVIKATSSPGSYLLYTSRVNAFIFPKRELGESKSLFIKCLYDHMEPSKIKIRGIS